MEEIDLSSAVNTDFSLNEIGQNAFCVESFGFVDSAEEFAKIPAGEEASIVVNVKLEGENAHFYSFSESEDPTARPVRPLRDGPEAAPERDQFCV